MGGSDTEQSGARSIECNLGDHHTLVISGEPVYGAATAPRRRNGVSATRPN
jgi:hypothetical protein